MHAITDGALAATWPCPITAEPAATLLPPPRRAIAGHSPKRAGLTWRVPQAVLFRPAGSYFGVGLSRNTSVSAFIDATVTVESGSASILSPRIRTWWPGRSSGPDSGAWMSSFDWPGPSTWSHQLRRPFAVPTMPWQSNLASSGRPDGSGAMLVQ